ncbi:hypothetical protein D4R75_09990 [bacterium]|nr:MAG: hypothetical protein D4R75_09990 [bacterium]
MTHDSSIDHIGFLNISEDFAFDGGRLTCSPNFAESKQTVESRTNLDGYVYPWITHRARTNLRTGKTRKLAHTERQTLLHQMPVSHDLVMEGTSDPIEARKFLSGFVMHCFSFLYGTRLQFHDWWLDGRIPMKSTVDVNVRLSAVDRFVSSAIHTWREKLDDRQRMVASNVLFLFAKSGSLEWDWEKCQMEYIVFDATFSLGWNKPFNPPHAQRFEAICETYGLLNNPDLTKLFVTLRNDLFHEALWDSGQPGTARSSIASYAPYNLRRFNHRLLTAILSGTSEYTKSDWWHMGPVVF